MNPYVQAFFDKAHQALSDARYLQADRRADAAINRAYYAAFHAAQAALLTVGETPRSHAGVKTQFGLRFVATGRVSASIGAILSDAESMRYQADYGALSTFDTGAVANLIDDVKTFVQVVEAEVLK